MSASSSSATSVEAKEAKEVKKVHDDWDPPEKQDRERDLIHEEEIKRADVIKGIRLGWTKRDRTWLAAFSKDDRPKLKAAYDDLRRMWARAAADDGVEIVMESNDRDECRNANDMPLTFRFAELKSLGNIRSLAILVGPGYMDRISDAMHNYLRKLASMAHESIGVDRYVEEIPVRIRFRLRILLDDELWTELVRIADKS
jgi:hypothetical protein